MLTGGSVGTAGRLIALVVPVGRGATGASGPSRIVVGAVGVEPVAGRLPSTYAESAHALDGAVPVHVPGSDRIVVLEAVPLAQLPRPRRESIPPWPSTATQ
jgi:hypothetical protein